MGSDGKTKEAYLQALTLCPLMPTTLVRRDSGAGAAGLAAAGAAVDPLIGRGAVVETSAGRADGLFDEPTGFEDDGFEPTADANDEGD